MFLFKLFLQHTGNCKVNITYHSGVHGCSEKLLVYKWYLFQNELQQRLLSKTKENRVNFKTSVTRKQRTPNFSKTNISYPPNTHMHVYISGGKKCLFFVKFDVLCFLVLPVLRFALFSYFRLYRLTTLL